MSSATSDFAAFTFPEPPSPPPKSRCRPALRSIEERNALVTAHMRLVRATINRYFPMLPAEARDDAFQTGLLGLIRAAELFDPALGFAFSTFAMRCIRQAIVRQGEECDLIRIPCHVRGEERRQVRARLRAVRLKSEHASNLPGRAEEPDYGEAALLAADVLSRLPRREAQVLRERFFPGRSLTEVARRMGISKERVRQIQERALVRARLLIGAAAAADGIL